MIIDATDLILGRMVAKVAKKALLGEEIAIINCEKALITGNKKDIIAKYKHRLELGQPTKGPFIQRRPDRFVRRTVRGMLPYKQEKGRNAYERVMCYIGFPEQFKNQKAETIKEASISKLPNLKYISVNEVCRQIGAK